MIGHLQSNKCKKLLSIPNLHVIETVDSDKIALKLNSICVAQGKTIPVLIEVLTEEDDTCTNYSLYDS